MSIKGCHWGWPLVGFPWSKPSTQMTIGSLFDMVLIRLKPSTGLLSLVRYLGVVSWSMGKAGGRSCDGLHSHRVEDVLTTYISTKHVQIVRALVHVHNLPYTK